MLPGQVNPCPAPGHAVATGGLSVAEALVNNGKDDDVCFGHVPSSAMEL